MPNAIGNAFVKAIASSPLHALLGPGLAVITVRGRKTGRVIATPINVVADEHGFVVTSLRSRSWWRNLRDGAPAELRVAGRQQAVSADVIEAEAAVAAGFACYFAAHPNLARYFGVALGPDRRPPPENLERLARERVIIYLHPSNSA